MLPLTRQPGPRQAFKITIPATQNQPEPRTHGGYEWLYVRLLRLAVDTHIVTSHCALPLLIRKPGGLVVEITDGTAEYNTNYRGTVGLYYDSPKSPPFA